MSNTIINANSFTPGPDDSLIFDCNALMYVFYIFGSYQTPDIQVYKRIFSEAVKNNSKIYVSSILISEFANTYIQNEYKRYMWNNHLHPKNFKFKRDYKKLSDYSETVKDVKSIINNQILSVSNRIDDSFSELSLDHLFDNESTFDFNDRYYGLLAERNSLKIVTNDADFAAISDITIITRNSVLLSQDPAFNLQAQSIVTP